jgi:hypothetical protein
MTKKQAKPSAKTLLLLGLWDLGGLEAAITRGQLLERVKKKGEKTEEYQLLLEQLQTDGAIEISGKSNAVKLKLTHQGLEALRAGLQDPYFVMEGAVVRAKTANALLRWMRTLQAPAETPAKSTAQAQNSSSKSGKLDSYAAFKVETLAVYDQLNREFNFDNLVPIYRIRRTLGNRVERSQFNEWLLEMQADDLFQLLEGSIEDSAQDKIEDSIMTKVSGLRCYAKRLAV